MPAGSPTILCEEDLLLGRAAAESLLKACEVTFARVIRVTVDGAILFVREGRVGAEYPMTAWTEVLKGRMCVRVENGWPVAQALNLVIRAARADSPRHEPDTED